MERRHGARRDAAAKPVADDEVVAFIQLGDDGGHGGEVVTVVGIPPDDVAAPRPPAPPPLGHDFGTPGPFFSIPADYSPASAANGGPARPPPTVVAAMVRGRVELPRRSARRDRGRPRLECASRKLATSFNDGGRLA